MTEEGDRGGQEGYPSNRHLKGTFLLLSGHHRRIIIINMTARRQHIIIRIPLRVPWEITAPIGPCYLQASPHVFI
jgi:hypothetical protein